MADRPIGVTALPWIRRSVGSEKAMTDPDSHLYEIGTSVSDRLGRHANQDAGWFDQEVGYWSEPDGVRLYVFELSDLGRKIVDWISGGTLGIPQAVFNEMEEILASGFGTDRGIDERAFCLNLLEGLDAELQDRQESDGLLFLSVTAELLHMMGDETKTEWVQVRSAG